MKSKFFPIFCLIFFAVSGFLFFKISAAQAATFDRPLSLGSSGSDVSMLQQILKDWNFFDYPEITGYFGLATQASVQKFQKMFGIVKSGTPKTTGYGLVGPKTISVLNMIKSFNPSSLVSQTNSPTTNRQTSIDPSKIVHRRGSVPSNNYTQNTVVVDNTAPIISTIATSSVDSTSVAVTWTTDELSNSRVDYGVDSSYGLATSSTAMTTSHSLTLTNLDPTKEYYFRIQSTDTQGNIATSSEQTLPQYVSTSGLIGDWRMYGLSAGTTVVPTVYGDGLTSSITFTNASVAADGIFCDGSTSYGTGTMPNNMAAWTIVAVVKPQQTAVGAHYILATQHWYMSQGGNLYSYISNGQGQKNFGANSAGIYDVVAIAHGNGTADVWQNSTKDSASFDNFNSNTAISVCSSITQTTKWSGTVNRVLLFNRRLSDSEYQLWYTALLHDMEATLWPSSVIDSFTRDDTVAPDIGTSDSGWPWVVQVAAGAGAYIHNHQFVADPGTTDYAKGRLNHKVEKIGMKYHWTTGNDGPNATQLVLAINDSTYFTNMLHFDLSRGGFSLDLWQNSHSVSNLISSSWDCGTQSTDGRQYTIEYSIQGDTVNVDAGDCGTFSGSDPLVSTLDNKFFYFEHVVPASTADNGVIEQIWAQ